MPKLIRTETDARETPEDQDYECPGCNGHGCDICGMTGSVQMVYMVEDGPATMAHNDVGYMMGISEGSPAYKRKLREIKKLQSKPYKYDKIEVPDD